MLALKKAKNCTLRKILVPRIRTTFSSYADRIPSTMISMSGLISRSRFPALSAAAAQSVSGIPVPQVAPRSCSGRISFLRSMPATHGLPRYRWVTNSRPWIHKSMNKLLLLLLPGSTSLPDIRWCTRVLPRHGGNNTTWPCWCGCSTTQSTWRRLKPRTRSCMKQCLHCDRCFTWTAWSSSSKEVIPTNSGFADSRSAWEEIQVAKNIRIVMIQGRWQHNMYLDNGIHEDGVEGKDKPHTVEPKAGDLIKRQ